MQMDEKQLLAELSRPDQGVLDTLANIQGDLLMLGAAGKIGHALTLMAKQGFEQLGRKNRVIAVSRFSAPGSEKMFQDDGVTTLRCDLADIDAVEKLPDASDVIYLVGQKFGTADNTSLTWLLNCFVPGIVARKWKDSRIAVYSSGNVYPFTPVTTDGPTEDVAPSPIGEYAQSVLGRERIFEYFSRANGTRTVTIRLNYANEPRYGVIIDLAKRILARDTIDLAQGYVNIVWQGDCNRVTIKSLDIASSPPQYLNLAGPKISVKALCEKIGHGLGVQPQFTGEPAANALLSDGSFCWKNFGPQTKTIDEMIDLACQWINAGKDTWNKPTHFEARDGKF